MQLLTYLETRKLVDEWSRGHDINLSEQDVEKVVAWSGRRGEWVSLALEWIASQRGDDPVVWVEETGIGREVVGISIEEQVYLYNPSLTVDESLLVKMGIIMDHRIVSTALAAWLRAQSKEILFRLSERDFTEQEGRMIRLLFGRRDSVAEREEIARALWGESWAEHYSDWEIDSLAARLRRKLSSSWQLVTVRGRGYMLAGIERSQAPERALGRDIPVMVSDSILPTDEYLSYMNDKNRVRKVYSDLFRAVEEEKIILSQPKHILCINSYSYDNVDAIILWTKSNHWRDVRTYFVHYDQRVIDMHQERIKELSAQGSIEVWHDDMRKSKLKDVSFDIVINDFRLNFNLDHAQNLATLAEMSRVTKTHGSALVSVVVDGRYENSRYGVDQEKAPLNVHRPALFQGDEHLIRRCWSVPYYQMIFQKTGWTIVREFDVVEGQTWSKKLTTTVDPRKGAFYRRFWLRKKG